MISEETSQHMMQFATNHLVTKQPQDDYLQLLELLSLFLKGTRLLGAKFCAPGHVHHARWMSKLLYALKVRMFWKQFSFIVQEEEPFNELYVFVIQVDIEAWFTAPKVIEALHQDLVLLKSVLQLFNKAVFYATSQKMSEDLNYCSEELIAFNFFDDSISFETKQNKISKL